MNSNCGVRSMRRHESHVSCVCIAGFSACGCQNTMEVGHTGTGWRYVCWLGEHQPCRVTPVVFRLSRIGFHQALVASLSFNLPNQNRPCVGGLKETAGEEAPQALWMGMELEIYPPPPIHTHTRKLENLSKINKTFTRKMIQENSLHTTM